MNNTFYLFGDFGDGYNQYPYDGAEATFRKVAQESQLRRQAFVRRNGEQMYYGFLRRLDEGAGRYVGLCYVVQGVMLSDVRTIIQLLEETVENMAIADRILGLDDHGNLVARVRQLTENRNELDRVMHVVEQRLPAIDSYWVALPQAQYGMSTDEIRTLTIAGDVMSLAKECCRNGYVLLQEPRNEPQYGNTAQHWREPRQEAEPTGYKTQDEAKTPPQAKSKPRPQTEEQTRPEPKRKKKKSTLGTVLKVLLWLGIIGVAVWWGYGEMEGVISSINDQKTEAANLHLTNRGLVDDVNMLRSTLEQKEAELERLKERVNLQDTIIDALMDQGNVRQPLVTTGLYVTRKGEQGDNVGTIGREVRLHRGEELEVYFRYVGIREGTARVTLQISSPQNTWWIFSAPKVIERNIPVRAGSGTYGFGAWYPERREGWEPGKYVVELLLDGVTVQTKVFEVRG